MEEATAVSGHGDGQVDGGSMKGKVIEGMNKNEHAYHDGTRLILKEGEAS